MAAGLGITKAQFDDLVGSTALTGKVFFERVEVIKDFLDQYTSQGLVDAGLAATTGDADVIKSAYGDLAQLEDLWRGGATLGAAKDFRAFAKRLWGVGVRNTNT